MKVLFATKTMAGMGRWNNGRMPSAPLLAYVQHGFVCPIPFNLKLYSGTTSSLLTETKRARDVRYSTVENWVLPFVDIYENHTNTSP